MAFKSFFLAWICSCMDLPFLQHFGVEVALELAYSVFFQQPELFQAHTNGQWQIGCFTKTPFLGIHIAQS